MTKQWRIHRTGHRFANFQQNNWRSCDCSTAVNHRGNRLYLSAPKDSYMFFDLIVILNAS